MATHSQGGGMVACYCPLWMEDQFPHVTSLKEYGGVGVLVTLWGDERLWSSLGLC